MNTQVNWDVKKGIRPIMLEHYRILLEALNYMEGGNGSKVTGTVCICIKIYWYCEREGGVSKIFLSTSRHHTIQFLEENLRD